MRKGRLTASNFGSVLNAGRITPSLLKRLLGEYDLSRVKAVQWGVQNEAEAINHFRKCAGLPVAETGIWLDPNGVLGASPDGLIGQNHVLEVKCPYTQRNLTIAEAVLNDSFCLKRNHDGTYQLGVRYKTLNFVVFKPCICSLYMDATFSNCFCRPCFTLSECTIN